MRFPCTVCPLLGYIVSVEGMRMDPDRVQAVVDWPTPDSRKALQRFLGFANFYRRFIRSFQPASRPFDRLNLHQDSVQVVQRSGGCVYQTERLLCFSSHTHCPDPSRQFVWRLTRRRWGLVLSYPSVLPRTTRCTRARIFLTVCLPLNATMILVIENCWQSSLPWRNGVIG